MIKLKSNNLFVKTDASSIYGIKRVLDFQELLGKNILGIGKDIGVTKNIQINKVLDEIKDHLYNIDIIAIIYPYDVKWYLREIRKIVPNIDIIFIIEDTHDYFIHEKRDGFLKKGRVLDATCRFDTIYQFDTIITDGNFLSNKNYMIKSLVDGWETDLESLKTQYIRDFKLDNLLGNIN